MEVQKFTQSQVLWLLSMACISSHPKSEQQQMESSHDSFPGIKKEINSRIIFPNNYFHWSANCPEVSFVQLNVGLNTEPQCFSVIELKAVSMFLKYLFVYIHTHTYTHIIIIFLYIKWNNFVCFKTQLHEHSDTFYSTFPFAHVPCTPSSFLLSVSF